MKCIADADRTMVVLQRRNYIDMSGLPIQRTGIAARGIVPPPSFRRHETHAINTLAVIKPVRYMLLVTLPKRRSELNIDERISICRSRKTNFNDPPLFVPIVLH